MRPGWYMSIVCCLSWCTIGRSLLLIHLELPVGATQHLLLQWTTHVVVGNRARWILWILNSHWAWRRLRLWIVESRIEATQFDTGTVVLSICMLLALSRNCTISLPDLENLSTGYEGDQPFDLTSLTLTIITLSSPHEHAPTA